MHGFPKVNLEDIVSTADEKTILQLLNSFQCPYNSDVEDFIHNKAITFSRQSLASVWLVFASFRNAYVLVGYYALANKHFHLDLNALSKTQRKKLQRFATLDAELGKYIVTAPLIGQLGKNYANGYDKLIEGDVLLDIACQTVKDAQRLLGGKLVYLECEDTPKLIAFYERNGFFYFGKRNLDRDEKEKNKGEYLLQFFKYLK